MWVYICLLVYASSNIQLSVQKSTITSPTYIAAVVEYSPVVGTTEDVSKNVANYALHMSNAAKQGADIIVFPECGLVGFGNYMKFSTPLPDPIDKVNPCENSSSNVKEEIRTLSCEAKKNDIYLVVNVPEEELCTANTVNCSDSGVRYFNSDVAFDRSGTVVARYRKFNLYGEPGFSSTLEPEFSILDTDFGVKFGIFTCFDIVFEKPAVSLVQEFGITDVIFPTAWFSELPFLSAVQAQASWAYGLNVNFLAAGYNNPSRGSAGSGIYAGEDGPLVTIMPTASTTELLVATVPKKSNIRENIQSLSSTMDHQEETIRQKVNAVKTGIFMSRDILEPYKTVLLTEGDFNSTRTLCQNDLCCDFQVIMKEIHTPVKLTGKTYVYRLAVFDGVRSYKYKTGGLQVCAVFFCSNDSLSSCGVEIANSGPETFEASFDYIRISGNFRLKRNLQVPNTLIQDYGVLPASSFRFIRVEVPDKEEVRVSMETRTPITNIMTFGILGRDFQKDGLPATSECQSVHSLTMYLFIFVSFFPSYLYNQLAVE